MVTLEVFHPGLPDWRGVEVGDSLEEVMAVYPEAIQYRTEGGGFGLDYNPSPDYPGRFASFYFNQDRTLSSFLLKYAFD
ncbi:hypothetical protein SDC9_109024 [bioreactor metagenome]|uniref:Uncharacterized protein n=1 Tax=bioreactor metagenome TaxID=1076179 RepID=A0A645BAT9_9ZZZZ